METEVYFYNGIFIKKDKAGDGYNVFKGFQIFDEGIQTIKKAMESIDRYKADTKPKEKTGYRGRNKK